MTDKQKQNLIHLLTENLPLFRKKLKISQQELANMLEVSRSTITNIENRRSPLSWNLFLALILIFNNNEETRKLVEHFDLYCSSLNRFLLGDQKLKENPEAGRKNKMTMVFAGNLFSFFFVNPYSGAFEHYLKEEKEDRYYCQPKPIMGESIYEYKKQLIDEVVYEADAKLVDSFHTRANFIEIFEKEISKSVEFRYHRGNMTVWLRNDVLAGTDCQGRKVLIIVVEDITKERESFVQAEVLLKNGESPSSYAQIARALLLDYEDVYYVNMDTNNYYKFDSSSFSSTFELNEKKEDFFEDIQVRIANVVYSQDRETMRHFFNRERLLELLRQEKSDSINYRLVIKEELINYRSKAVFINVDNVSHMVVGTVNVEKQTRREQIYRDRIRSAMEYAGKDFLTNVKNKNSYLLFEKHLNKEIRKGINKPFAVVVCDINDLKQLNDAYGHEFGDEVIKNAAKMISRIFKNSTIYRTGGDEFAAIISESDFDQRKKLIKRLRRQAILNTKNGRFVIASGLADFQEEDIKVADVFVRADREMYKNKADLKEYQLFKPKTM
ncbi:MAG: diguanylate cyclase domain-containing protein [Bacilli bacterium]|jgi:diguanylate cyclase (GGDEF)-like protein